MDPIVYKYSGEPVMEDLQKAFIALQKMDDTHWKVTKCRLTGITGQLITMSDVEKMKKWMSQ